MALGFRSSIKIGKRSKKALKTPEKATCRFTDASSLTRRLPRLDYQSSRISGMLHASSTTCSRRNRFIRTISKPVSWLVSRSPWGSLCRLILVYLQSSFVFGQLGSILLVIHPRYLRYKATVETIIENKWFRSRSTPLTRLILRARFC